jgi:hypothetical protein
MTNTLQHHHVDFGDIRLHCLIVCGDPAVVLLHRWPDPD